MKKYDVYNLVFPDYVDEMEIFRYKFRKISEYDEAIKILHKKDLVVQNYTHSVTANVEIPHSQESAVIAWENSESTELDDILLLLSLFTGRSVFLSNSNESLLIEDPRSYEWGWNLHAYVQHGVQLKPNYNVNLGLDVGINRVYTLIRTKNWQDKYDKGFFLFLLKAL